MYNSYFFLLKYTKTLKYFGEDQEKTKFEDFFTIWSTFLIAFNETRFELKVKKDRLAESLKRQKDLESLNSALKLRPKSIQLQQIQSTYPNRTNKIEKYGI
jgi:hypothetical protein